MSIIRLRDCRATPWKNGMGRTRELAVHPPGAGMDDFIWRVSVAEVDSAAPFSAFAGIDRYIALLEGAGFTMMLDDGQTHALTTPFAPFAFSGEAQVTVELKGGPTRDFNLMLRRANASGELVIWDEPGRQIVDDSHSLDRPCHTRSRCIGTCRAGRIARKLIQTFKRSIVTRHLP
jgi:environmental stress-induced protein Ves